MNPISTKRNKYYKNPKNNKIYTPLCICDFLFDLLNPIFKKRKRKGYIVDPSIGSGNLIFRFNDNKYKIIGYDIDNSSIAGSINNFHKYNFLETCIKINDVLFVICNPPFNTDIRNKKFLKENKLGKALLPELFADKVFSLYGESIPLILITPMGLRLNQRIKSDRWRKMRDKFPPITSIISLPLDIFPSVEFHSEIIIFNLPELDSHYWLPEKYINSISKGD